MDGKKDPDIAIAARGDSKCAQPLGSVTTKILAQAKGLRRPYKVLEVGKPSFLLTRMTFAVGRF